MPLWVNGYLMRGHVAIITKTESTYVIVGSTLWFDDVEDILGLLPLLRAVQRSRMWSRERSRRRLGNEATKAHTASDKSWAWRPGNKANTQLEGVF